MNPFFSTLSTRSALRAGFVLCLVVSTAITLGAVFSLRTLWNSTSEAQSKAHRETLGLSSLKLTTQHSISEYRAFALSGRADVLERARDSAADVRRQLNKVKENFATEEKITTALSSTLAGWNEYERTAEGLVVAKTSSNKNESVEKHFEREMLPRSEKALQALDALAKNVEADQIQEGVTLRTRALRSINWIIGATLLGLLIMIVLCFVIEKKIETLIRKDGQNSQLIEAIIENASSGIALLDPKLRFIHVNRTFVEMTRIAKEDHLGKTPEQILPGLPGRSEETLQIAMANKTASMVEIVSEGNPTFYGLVSYFPVGKTGENGYGMIITDITKIRVVEEQLKRSNDQLERFAYQASHDLKEPIRTISTYLGLFMEEYSSSIVGKGSVYLNYASQGAKRLSNLVDALLRFSRLGTQKLDMKNVPLVAVINETLVSLRKAIEETKAQIHCGELVDVCGDRIQLSILFQNLISNALKFHRKGSSPQVWIEATMVGGRVQVEIRDNGIGIRATDKEKIFEIFRRMHARSEFPGEGIGLAECKRIVESHEGLIWVESSPEGGSRFICTLPPRTEDCEARSA